MAKTSAFETFVSRPIFLALASNKLNIFFSFSFRVKT